MRQPDLSRSVSECDLSWCRVQKATEDLVALKVPRAVYLCMVMLLLDYRYVLCMALVSGALAPVELEEWWRLKMQTAFAGRIEGTITWPEFLTVFSDIFCPVQIQQAKREQFWTLQQGNLSVLEYQMRFVALSRELGPESLKVPGMGLRQCGPQEWCWLVSTVSWLVLVEQQLDL
ncbi:hypothetical protein Taro_050532 [Colocasia esculenta]|uniref:Retrotransposon gag domain-containing protein n=1 Tax=Colocasia esculenta TaxID=4460 RepID=A0A843XEA4_COLES|nr:hypothetical protein [Colocasia esculenta]